MKQKLLWITINLCRLIIAGAFIFSGLTKVIDPHGTEYKLHDYAEAFGLGYLMPDLLALMLAIALAVFEFRLGFCTFFGIYRRFTSCATLAFLCVFTPLTLYLALANPVSDCGCFGDALVLTNWQTFFKNVVLLACSLVLVKWYPKQLRIISEGRQWIILIYAQLFALALALYALWFLPVYDFRPYRIGANLQELTQPTGDGEYVTSFLMEKDGQQQWFTTEEYPDSTWTYLDSKTELVGDVTPAVIDNFTVYTWPEGDDVTEDVLHDPGYVFLLVAPSLENADDGRMDAYNNIYEYAQRQDYRFLCLTSSNDEAIVRWQDLTGAEYPFCHTDELTLKTVVRSNPGLVLLHDGVVVNKWPYTDMPDLQEESPALEQTEYGTPDILSQTRQVLRLLLWFVVPLIVVTFLDRTWWWVTIQLNRRRKRKKAEKDNALRKAPQDEGNDNSGKAGEPAPSELSKDQ